MFKRSKKKTKAQKVHLIRQDIEWDESEPSPSLKKAIEEGEKEIAAGNLKYETVEEHLKSLLG